MKNLKKYVGVLMLLTLLVGFTSCEDDETIFDHIVGHKGNFYKKIDIFSNSTILF